MGNGGRIISAPTNFAETFRNLYGGPMRASGPTWCVKRTEWRPYGTFSNERVRKIGAPRFGSRPQGGTSKRGAAAPLCLVGFKERGFSRGEGNRNPSPLERRFAILEPIYDPAAAVINGRGGARERAQFSSLRRKRSLAHFATTSRRGQRRSLRRAKSSGRIISAPTMYNVR